MKRILSKKKKPDKNRAFSYFKSMNSYLSVETFLANLDFMFPALFL